MKAKIFIYFLFINNLKLITQCQWIMIDCNEMSLKPFSWIQEDEKIFYFLKKFYCVISYSSIGSRLYIQKKYCYLFYSKKKSSNLIKVLYRKHLYIRLNLIFKDDVWLVFCIYKLFPNISIDIFYSFKQNEIMFIEKYKIFIIPRI